MNYTVDVEGHQEFIPRQNELKLKNCTPVANCSTDAGIVENTSRTYWESGICMYKRYMKFSLFLRIITLMLLMFSVTLSKTEVAFPEMQFVGHTTGQCLLKPNSENIGKILYFQVPRSKKHVRGFIDIVNFYSKFIPNIADLLSPMHELTKKGQPEKVTWGEECQASLCKIQELISSEPALIVPDIDALFFVQTDASGSGLGCVLLQMRDGNLRPCRFHSRKLFPRETRYAVIEREALAIVWGLQKLSRFLLGTEFVLQTDHAPLTCITGGRTQNARLTRWALILQQFSFKIEYIKGARNNVADYLSRFVHH